MSFSCSSRIRCSHPDKFCALSLGLILDTLELEELPVLGIAALPVLEPEELLVVAVTMGVAVAELLVVGAAVAVGVEVSVAIGVAVAELEELLVVGAAVAVAELLLVPELEEPVLGMAPALPPPTSALACAKANSYSFIHWRSLFGFLEFTKFLWFALNLASQARSAFSSRMSFALIVDVPAPGVEVAVALAEAAKTPNTETTVNTNAAMSAVANPFIFIPSLLLTSNLLIYGLNEDKYAMCPLCLE